MPRAELETNIRCITLQSQNQHKLLWYSLKIDLTAENIFIKHLEKFALDNNCDKMELIARPGWERVLRNFRYKKSHVLLEKSLKK